MAPKLKTALGKAAGVLSVQGWECLQWWQGLLESSVVKATGIRLLLFSSARG